MNWPEFKATTIGNALRCGEARPTTGVSVLVCSLVCSVAEKNDLAQVGDGLFESQLGLWPRPLCPGPSSLELDWIEGAHAQLQSAKHRRGIHNASRKAAPKQPKADLALGRTTGGIDTSGVADAIAMAIENVDVGGTAGKQPPRSPDQQAAPRSFQFHVALSNVRIVERGLYLAGALDPGPDLHVGLNSRVRCDRSAHTDSQGVGDHPAANSHTFDGSLRVLIGSARHKTLFARRLAIAPAFCGA